MYTLILFISITLIGYVIGGIIYGNRYKGNHYSLKDGLGTFLIAIGILSSCVLLIACGDFINLDARFQKTIYEYENTVRMVESYDGQDYGNMIPLVESVVSINKEIARQKAYVKSPWRNLWMSEDIANLKPITFPAKRVKPVQTE